MIHFNILPSSSQPGLLFTPPSFLSLEPSTLSWWPLDVYLRSYLPPKHQVPVLNALFNNSPWLSSGSVSSMPLTEHPFSSELYTIFHTSSDKTAKNKGLPCVSSFHPLLFIWLIPKLCWFYVPNTSENRFPFFHMLLIFLMLLSQSLYHNSIFLFHDDI